MKNLLNWVFPLVISNVNELDPKSLEESKVQQNDSFPNNMSHISSVTMNKEYYFAEINHSIDY